MGEKYILITGRTLEQGRTIHLGKDSPEYLDEVSTVEMSKPDMERMGLRDGEKVRIRTEQGDTILRCRKSSALPQGVVFMPYGPPANILIGPDTGGTGMPDFKNIEVEIEPLRMES